jgi:4-amino-4-deoxy-L-arabinose transferase-like glycosyltransferase
MRDIDGALRGGAASLPLRHPLAAAILLALLVCCAGTFSHSLWSPDEPTGAVVGRAMFDSGDLIVPRLNGSPFLEKPPLYWWVQVAGFHLFGLSHGVARLPSALFGVLTMLTTYLLGRRLGGRLGGMRQGLLAAAVLGSTALFAEEVERVVVDPALAFFVALTHYGFAVLAEPRSARERRGSLVLIALAVPLAFLSKGVVALGLGVVPPVLWLLATRRTRALRDLLPLAALGVPLFALFVVPWAVALYKAAGWPALQECLLNNTTGRFLNDQRGTVYGHRQPWWYYGSNAPAVLLPWSLTVPAMLKAGLLRRRRDVPAPPGSEARALLFSTVILGILFLSVAASKRELYLLPLLPAFSVCVAWWLEGVGKERKEEDGKERIAERSWDRPTLVLLTGLAIALPLLLWGFALVVKLAPPRQAALAPLRDGLTPAVLAVFGLAVLGGSGILLIHLLRSRRTGLTPIWVITPYLLLFMAVESGIKRLVDPVKSLSDMTVAVARYLPGTDPVPAYLPPGVSNESLFGILGFDLGRRTRPLTTPEALMDYWERDPAALVLVRAEDARRLPPALFRRLRFVYDEIGRKASPYAIAGWSGG